LAWQ
jgi:hypothetical protein